MRNSLRKFIAVLMLLWLPLSGSSALAASVSMQLLHGDCHEAAMQNMPQHDAAGHHQHMPAHGKQGFSCNSCGLCHLSCSAFMAVSQTTSPALYSPAQKYTPYSVSFSSVTTLPLLPPPLARA